MPNYAGLLWLLTRSRLHKELNKYKAQLQKVGDHDKPFYYFISIEVKRNIAKTMLFDTIMKLVANIFLLFGVLEFTKNCFFLQVCEGEGEQEGEGRGGEGKTNTWTI